MKHVSIYLDSGYYTISDKAAGKLCSDIGHKLPKIGYEKSIYVNAWIGGELVCLSAWITRAYSSFYHGKRGWKWSICNFKDINGFSPILGKTFYFITK
jgi:hypothetical protein